MADSRGLFATSGQPPSPLLERLRQQATEAVQAVYLGASNGHDPAAREIFEAAMAGVGVERREAIPRYPEERHLRALARAEIIVLAGGDPAVGWRGFEAAMLLPLLEERYRAGATLIGISAGAVQMGLGFEDGDEVRRGLRWAPFWVAVHAEGEDWQGLRRQVAADSLGRPGLAVPGGAQVQFGAGGRVLNGGPKVGRLLGEDFEWWVPSPVAMGLEANR
ncbi:MAG: hypothetical protein AAF604_15955 [Acidobacteriota bacterium]